MGNDLDIVIETPLLKVLCDIALKFNGYGKSSGAGGGDCGVAIFTMDNPFFINAMTGGSDKTKSVNEKLATVARRTNLAMASGSLSVAIKDPSVVDSFEVIRKVNPDGLIFANLGAEHTVETVKRAIDKLLDLTDQDVLDTFDRLWQQYCKRAKIDENQPIGKRLDMLFDSLKIIDDSFKVIRVFGKYEKVEEKDFLIYKTKKDKNSVNLTNKIKMVYCVRSYEYVCNRALEEVVKNEFYGCN